MAFFVPRSLGVMARCMMSSARNKTVQPTRFNSALSSVKMSKMPTTSSVFLMKFNMHSKTCGCCGYHTQGDKQMVNFLSEEIALEKNNSTRLPSIKDFDITPNEAEVVLTKKFDGETVKVRFNVNHTVESEEPSQGEDNEESQMVSKPPFSVEISKGDQLTLTIQCSFPPGEELEDPSAQGDEIVDEFDIEEIALHGAEWEDSTYVVSAATMDGNLYDLLMTMLEDRGINNDFTTELVNYSTAYEQTVYVNFLEKLQKFVDQK